MKSKSSSCFGTIVLGIALLVLIRFALPGVWRILALFFAGTFYAGLLLLLVAFLVLAYYTYKNLKKNQRREYELKYARIDRTQQLYRSIQQRLERDIAQNQVSVEELLQSELLIGQILQEMKKDLLKLKEFASPAQEKNINHQMRDYKQQLQQSHDDSVKQLIRENLRLVEERKQRMQVATEEIRQKEGLVDLVFNRLQDVDEDLRMGRKVERLFPPDIYRKFGLVPPAGSEKLPPLSQSSAVEE